MTAAKSEANRFSRTQTSMFFDRDIEPIGTVRVGELTLVETADAACGLIKTNRDVFGSFDELLNRLGGADPVTGPIYIEGAKGR